MAAQNPRTFSNTRAIQSGTKCSSRSGMKQYNVGSAVKAGWSQIRFSRLFHGGFHMSSNTAAVAEEVDHGTILRFYAHFSFFLFSPACSSFTQALCTPFLFSSVFYSQIHTEACLDHDNAVLEHLRSYGIPLLHNKNGLPH